MCPGQGRAICRAGQGAARHSTEPGNSLGDTDRTARDSFMNRASGESGCLDQVDARARDVRYDVGGAMDDGSIPRKPQIGR